MKKLFSFFKKLFSPKFSISFILPNGTRVIVRSSHGTEKEFKEIVMSFFSKYIDDDNQVKTGMYYE